MAPSATLSRWGNGVGLLIPKAVRDEAGFELGDRVTFSAREGVVQIQAEDAEWTLHDLMAGYTGPAPEFIDPGASVGSEVW